MGHPILHSIRRELEDSSDPKIRESSQHFFKEKILGYGIKTALVREISKGYFKAVKDRTKTEVFVLCEELWQSGYREESLIACDWSYRLHKQYEPDDFEVFESWLASYVDNWASCDTLCNHSMGAFIDRYPEYIHRLKLYANSDNRWKRRAAAVTLILPARKGKFLQDILEIADLLLLDKDDLVQKGYGWMLKEASQAHQPFIFDYVMKNKALMPRTALRYAIEKMPKAMKAMAMER